MLIKSNGGTDVYHKMHLGGDEPRFFVPGAQPLLLTVDGHKVGIAICADSSRTTHPEASRVRRADLRGRSVLDSQVVPDGRAPFSYLRRDYGLLTVMANQATSVGSYESVSKSAIWTPEGRLLIQAAGTENVLLIAASTNGIWRSEVVAL